MASRRALIGLFWAVLSSYRSGCWSWRCRGGQPGRAASAGWVWRGAHPRRPSPCARSSGPRRARPYDRAGPAVPDPASATEPRIHHRFTGTVRRV